MFKSLKTISVIFSALLLLATATSVWAAPAPQEMAACEQTYSVQADDWLSKLAEKFYGDIYAYPAIVDATNTIAQTDGEYATIDNPDLIEIGWVLCIPSSADAKMMMDDNMMMDDGAMADEGEMMDDGTMSDEGEMMDDSSMSDDGETMDDGSMSDDGEMMDDGSMNDDGEMMDDGSMSDEGTMESSGS